jgi:hypothetical protein
MERHLNAKKPMSIVMAIPDHPWTKATPDTAAVRIAMTVGEAGSQSGVLREVIRETALDTDTPVIEFEEHTGIINSDLTVGIDVSRCVPLKANQGLSSRGMMLFGSGFIVTPQQAVHLGLGKRPGLDLHIRPYLNGRDLTSRSRGLMVIDLFGLSSEEVRQQFPEVYQQILATVKPERDVNRDKDISARWWLFGRTRDEIRPALDNLSRYIVTVETAKHRVFQFLQSAIIPDNKLLVVALADGFHLGVLSSRIHCIWALRAGGWLGVGNDPVYVKSRCFDPFPWPVADEDLQQSISAVAEEIDAHRKRVLAEHPHLTLTGIYNVLESLRAVASPQALGDEDRRIFNDGLVLVLRELHDKLDAAVAAAYGWPANLSEDEVLLTLVVLNKERAQEETRGFIRWLRPEYQIPRFGSPKEKAELDLVGAASGQEVEEALAAKSAFPTDDVAQTAAVMAVLAAATIPQDAISIASSFKQGRRSLPKVEAVLAALTRVGLVGTPDGQSFTFRRPN